MGLPSASSCIKPSMQSAITSNDAESVHFALSRDTTFEPSMTLSLPAELSEPPPQPVTRTSAQIISKVKIFFIVNLLLLG